MGRYTTKSGNDFSQVEAWVDECLDVVPSGVEMYAELYECYLSWSTGKYQHTKNAVTLVLKGRGCRIGRRKAGRYVSGVRIKTSDI